MAHLPYPQQNSILRPLGLAFLMKALKIAYVGTNYHGNAWQVAWISCLRWLMRALVDHSYLRSPGFWWDESLYKGNSSLILLSTIGMQETTHLNTQFAKKDNHSNPFLGGGNSNIFYFHHYYLGKWSNLTSIFVKWVGSTINSNALSRGWIYLIIPIQSIHFAVSFQDPKICPTVETVLFDALLKTRLIQDTFDLGWISVFKWFLGF